MAERVSPDLYNQIKDLNRLRDRKIQGYATGIVPTFAAQRAGGPLMAQQVANSFMPQAGPGTGMSGADKIEAKTKILEKMGKNQEKLRSDYIGQADKLMAVKDNIDQAIELVLGASGLDNEARIAFMKSWNDQSVAIMSNANNNVASTVQGASRVNAPAVKNALEEVRKAMNADAQAGVMDEGITSALADQLEMIKATGDAATIASFVVQANDIIAAGGGADLKTFLEGRREMGDGRAASALAIVNDPAPAAMIGEMNDLAIKSYAANSAAALENLRGASYAPDKVIDLLGQVLTDERLQGAFIGKADPTQALATLDDLFKNAPGNTPKDLAAWDKLLEEIDNQDLPPTSSLYEARKRIYADPQFQEFKAKNGLADDQMALKELRRNIRDQRFSDRQLDRDNIRRKRQGLPLNPVPIASGPSTPPAEGTDPAPAPGPQAQTPAQYTELPKLKPTLGMGLSSIGNAVSRPANSIRTAGNAIQDILRKKKPPKSEADDLEEQKL